MSEPKKYIRVCMDIEAVHPYFVSDFDRLVVDSRFAASLERRIRDCDVEIAAVYNVEVITPEVK